MAKPATQTNNFDPEIVNNLLARIDDYKAEISSERGQSMQRCRAIRESISNCFREAKAKGIPTSELRALLKIRDHEAASRKIYDELEKEQKENLALLAATERVKDLPLWRIASEKAPKKKSDLQEPSDGFVPLH